MYITGDPEGIPYSVFTEKLSYSQKFIQKYSQYVGIEELTPYVLHELVKAIYVDAPDKSSGKRRQHIHIRYDGLGFIPLNELLTSEKA